MAFSPSVCPFSSCAVAMSEIITRDKQAQLTCKYNFVTSIGKGFVDGAELGSENGMKSGAKRSRSFWEHVDTLTPLFTPIHFPLCSLCPDNKCQIKYFAMLLFLALALASVSALTSTLSAKQILNICLHVCCCIFWYSCKGYYNFVRKCRIILYN